MDSKSVDGESSIEELDLGRGGKLDGDGDVNS